jgi:hypothetical protein
MSETGKRYRRVAARFTDRVNEMSPEAWDAPTPSLPEALRRLNTGEDC